jgi:putative redox protein
MIKLTLKKGLQFIAENDSKHNIIVDTNKDFGGFDEGFRPLELMLVSLAGCMGMDIVGILTKKGGKIKRFEIIVNAEREKEHPKRYKSITLNFKCEGDYKREDLLRSFELSRDKYCGAYATLRSTPEIHFVI